MTPCLLTKWTKLGDAGAIRGRFVRIYVAVARGASLRCAVADSHDACHLCEDLLTRPSRNRDELRAAFPTLQLTREAVHAFSCIPRRARMPRDWDSHAPYATPFGALRAAQLMAFGLDLETALLTLPWLLPPEPCADAGEEELLLASVRFLVQHGVFREARDCSYVAQSGVSRDALYSTELYSERFATLLPDNGYTLFSSELAGLSSLQSFADIGFLLHMRARAAQAARTPLRDAFSFRGRTLASLLQLAAQHRRKALVAIAGVHGRSDSRINRLLWRMPLEWDAACAAMVETHLDARRVPSGLLSSQWPGSLRTGVPGMSRIRGHWKMQELQRVHDILQEGEQQHNCLRYMHNISEDASYWSLRFTADADAMPALDGSTRTQLEHVVGAEHHTVCVQGMCVDDFKGPCNTEPTPAAARALAHWARCGVDLGEFKQQAAEASDGEEEEEADDAACTATSAVPADADAPACELQQHADDAAADDGC